MPSIEKRIAKKVGRAIFDYKMIEPDDRIMIAVSGGKDSLTLLHDMLRRQKSFPVPFTLEAVHIRTDFCTCCKEGKMEGIFDKLDIPAHIVPVAILGRLKPGRKMNCYWCSTQRRKELLAFAESRGCNKIALGHHMDDIIETYFMNICYRAETSGMLPVFKYEKFAGEVIRPLAMVPESMIIQFAKEHNLENTLCTCPYGTRSKRLDVRKAIADLAKTAPNVRETIFKAMHNVVDEYIPKKIQTKKIAGSSKLEEEPVFQGQD
jgi:tRNA 2-thiocytidine biosynthesis protein TtcA